MKYVLDLNMCRENQLKVLLDSGNDVMIPDDFLVEIFKANNPRVMFLRNIVIIKNYPAQIYICQDRGPLARKEIEKGLPLYADEIIDFDSTAIFRQWMIDYSEFNKVFPRAKNEAPSRIEYQKKFVKTYLRGSVKELKAMLKRDSTRTEYIKNRSKLLNDIRDVSIQVMEKYLEAHSITNIECFRRTNSIIYAQTYILLWRIAHWALINGIETTNDDRLANDGFDLKYVLISTFYDGILTHEEWLKECRENCIRSIDEPLL